MSRSLVSVIVVVLVAVALPQGFVGGAAADDVTLEVTVVDRNGFELGDVGISVTWDGGDGGPRTETTRANGKALIDVPDGADIAIRTDDDEYVRNRPYTVNDVQGGEVTVPVSEAGRATVVVEGEDGPIPDAAVRIRDAASQLDRQTTDGSGVARTALLEQGEYTLRVTAPGHLQRDVSIDITNVEKTETVSVRPADVDATVTVVDDNFDDPRPVDGATIRLADSGTTATTAGNGTATVAVPVNTRPEFVVSADGYDTARTRLRVEEDPVSTEVTIQRTPGVDVEALNRRVVVGESTVVTVTDQYDRPVEGATITVEAETIGQTDPQGRLSVPVETAGNVTIEASSGGNAATVSVEGVDPSAEGTPTETTPGATPRPGTETPGGDGAGFGVVAGVVALLCAGLLGWRD